MRISPSRWGIQRRYRDSAKRWQSVSDESVAAVLGALGADAPAPPERSPWPLVLRRGESAAVAADAVVELEDGSERPAPGALPPDLPLGYHRLRDGGRTRPLVVAPPRCHLPEGLREFGFAVQLYATRSQRSWGIGDLADLAACGRWARGLGAGMLLCSPLHAALPLAPVEASPYYPASRIFRNPLHLAVEALPGAAEAGIGDLAEAARRLNSARAIDRDRVASLKLEAAERVHAGFTGDGALDRYRAEQPLVEEFALFAALAERHGGDWRAWPAELRRPDGAGVAQARRELAGRIDLHRWMQWQLDRQLAEAALAAPLVLDLAVGFAPGGFDAWLWQDLLAPANVGAPPDTFNTQGQDWGLPAFSPWRLRDSAYAPFVTTLQANLRHARGLRIDHVMGLQRLWWVPPALGSRGGAYVQYPLDDLLAIVALESERAGALIVGEDLGTVAPGLRRRLRDSAVLSYRLLIFEDRPPRRWPAQALAAVSTHDLPTIAGLWDGSDLRNQEALGLHPDARANDAVLARLRAGGLAASAPVAEAIRHAHARLAQSPAMLLAATLEDLAEVAERPNQPGTTAAQNPNWSRALPLTLEELAARPLAAEVARLLRR